MGIRRLLTYCLNEDNNCYENVDLVQIAQQENGIEILVDFYNFIHTCLQKFAIELGRCSGNGYLILMGAEYITFDKYICNFVNKLKTVNITLQFYIDGAKGEDSQKMKTWKKRHNQAVDNLNLSLDVCVGFSDIRNLDIENCTMPVLFEIQILSSLLSCGCNIVQIPAEEADSVIAKNLLSRPKAFAILSSDSDFCIFENCRFIPDKLFDLNDDLPIGFEMAQPLTKLMCGIITNKKVIQSLGFSSVDELIDMSIVAGNDYTSHFLQNRLIKKLGCYSIEEYASMIRRFGRIENIDVVAEKMRWDTAFSTAVAYSRDIYHLSSQGQVYEQKGYFTKLIEERIQSGYYPAVIMGMHCNLYWQRIILEDTTRGQPCVENALETLRACIYHMILPAHIKTVKEYGRTSFDKLECYQVQSVDDRNIPKLKDIQPSKIFNNLRHFHYIITHLEKGSFETIWTDKYGRQTGFKCAMLRYFLLLNWGKNLYITPDEFLGLVAVVFGGYSKEAEYQSIVLCPSPRCVTLGNWLQATYRTMYVFLAKVLFLSQEFPLPKEIFSSSVWTVFYACSDKRECNFIRRSNQRVEIFEAKKQMNLIIKDMRHIIKHITDGCFHFDDRW